MHLSEYISASKAKHADLARDMECDPTQISHVVAGRRQLRTEAAIRLYRKRGVKVDPISHATDDEIAVLERFSAPAA